MSLSKKIGLLIIGIIALTGAGMLSSTTFAELLLNTFQGGKVTGNLVAQWSFDGRFLDTSSSTSEVKDGTGTHNGNWLNHSTTTDIGKLGQALYFDGYDDKVSVADDNALDFTGSDQFSISLWFNSTASTTYASGYSGTSTYYFNSYDIGGEEWGTTPENMVDGSTATYATDNTDNLVQALKSSEAVATTSGAVPDKVEYRAFGYQDTGDNGDLDMWPVFSGTTDGPITIWAIPVTTGAWSPYYDITSTTSAPSPWTWTDLVNLDMDIRVNKNGGPDVMNVARVETRVEWSVPGQSSTGAATTTLFSKADGTSGGYKIYLQGDGDLCFAIDDDATWNPDDEICTSGTDYSDTSDWHHVIASKDGTSGIYLYVDDPNTPVASSTTLTATGDLSNASPLYIGDDGETSYDEYIGLLDEVALYSSVLTQPERERLYSLGQTILINASQIGKLSDNLTTYFSMNGTSISNQSLSNDAATTAPSTSSGFPSAAFVASSTASASSSAPSGSSYGKVVRMADINDDNWADIIVSDEGYNSNQGQVYIYYGDGSLPSSTTTADVIITGAATGDYFGSHIRIADINNDTKNDIVVGAKRILGAGSVYVFYGDGSIPTTAGTADLTFGGGTQGAFARSLALGDFDGDNDIDIAVGGEEPSAFYYGRVFIFYNDGSWPSDADSADVIIESDVSNNQFGYEMISGNFNQDTKDDLLVASMGSPAELFMFYGSTTMPTTTLDADIDFTLEANIGDDMVVGDWNQDGYDDFAVSETSHPATNKGRVYVMYGDGSIPTSLASADVQITGVTDGDQFGFALAAGDWNGDGEDDLAVVEQDLFDNAVYVYYSDGSLPTTPDSADVRMEADQGTAALASGDWDNDGDIDLVMGVNYNSDILYVVETDTIGGGATINGATETIGVIGQALSFDGSTAYVAVGDISAYGTTTSMSFWIKTNDTTSRPLIKLNDLASIELDSSGNASTTGSGWSASTTIYVDRQTSSLAITNDWHHIVVIDEQGLQATSTELGRSGGLYYDGILDEVRFYSDVLTKDEINKLYAQGGTFVLNAPQKEKQTENLLGYWTFDGPDTTATYVKNVTSVDTSLPFATTSFDAEDANVIFNGEVDYDYLGESVAFAGDVNGDGFDDVLLGAYQAEAGGTDRGEAYIFYGPFHGTSSIDAENADVIFTGEADADWFGYRVAGAGDVNNDGFDDVLVGAFWAEDAGCPSTKCGMAYLFLGSATLSGTVGAASADAIFNGEADNDLFSVSLAGVGDVNNDGNDDILVGAHGQEGAAGCTTSCGRAYLFLGPLSGSINAENADVIFEGEDNNDLFGFSVSGAGDVNGDGNDDVFVGAYQATDTAPCTTGCGSAYLFMGPFTGTTTVHAENADVVFRGGADDDDFGEHVSKAGDVNGDGYGDLLVGAWQAEDAGSFRGRAYLFYGPFSGTTSVDAENADVIFNGEVDIDRFGDTVDWAGDVNGDGYDDILVAADQAEWNDATCTGLSCGIVYIFLGPFTGTSSVDAESADIIFGGENNSDSFGVWVAGGGDTNADGYADILVGMPSGEDVGGSCAAFQDCGQAFLITSFEAYLGERTGSPADIGRIGQGMSFNGTTDRIDVGDMSSGGTVRSISFWMKADATGGPIMNIGFPNNSISAGGWELTSSFSSPTYYVDGLSGEQTVSTDWHHVVVTDTTGHAPDTVIFGFSNGVMYDGLLDEIRFYDYVLSQEEVTKLYLQGK